MVAKESRAVDRNSNNGAPTLKNLMMDFSSLEGSGELIDAGAQMGVQNVLFCPRLQSISGGFGSGSPHLAYCVREFDAEAKTSATNVFVHSSDTLKTLKMTSHAPGTSSATSATIVNGIKYAEEMVCYLQDGRVWSMALRGGCAVPVTPVSLSIDGFKIFVGPHDRVWLLAVMNVAVGDADQSARETTSTGIVFDSLMIRHWDTWSPYAKRNHLFLIPLMVTPDGLLGATDKEPIDLMQGLHTDCPGKSAQDGDDDFAVAPDGSSVVMSMRRPVDQTGRQRNDMAWTTDTGIYIVELDKNGPVSPPVLISGSKRTYNRLPVYSPCSKYIAYLSMDREGYESDRLDIKIHNICRNKSIQLTHPDGKDIDLCFQGVQWDPSGLALFSTVYHKGVTRVFRIDIDIKFDIHFDSQCAGEDASVPSNALDTQVEEHFVHATSINMIIGQKSKGDYRIVRSSSGKNDFLYYLESSLSNPPELKRVTLRSESGLNQKLFTALNLDKLDDVGEAKLPNSDEEQRLLQAISIFCPAPEFENGDIAIPNVTQHFFKGADGDLVHAWYLSPTTISEAQPNASVPLALLIHGGPQSAFQNAWSYRWNLSLFASQGYAILAVNFHGSIGYGQKFTDSIHESWGGRPFEDLMLGVDYILSAYPYLDRSRIGALGASYGGYMINWINGHTDRFKCLVNHDGIFSLRSLYYNTEEIWFPEWEFGRPWEPKGKEQFDRWSPDGYVSNWKTPCLVIQGGKDFRCCEGEGVATFTALQRRGVESRLLYFPDEGHWVLKAKNSELWYNTVIGWMDKWLKDDILTEI